MNQSIIERSMLKKYIETEKLVNAARRIVPSEQDIKNKEANEKLSLAFKWGYKNVNWRAKERLGAYEKAFFT